MAIFLGEMVETLKRETVETLLNHYLQILTRCTDVDYQKVEEVIYEEKNQPNLMVNLNI